MRAVHPCLRCAPDSPLVTPSGPGTARLNGDVSGAPITFEVDGRQYLAEAGRLPAAPVRTGATVPLSHDFLAKETVDIAEACLLQTRVNPDEGGVERVG